MIIRQLSLVILLSTFALRSEYAQLCNNSPDVIEFAFDMHETLVTKNVSKMISVALKRAGVKVTKMAALLSYEYSRFKLDGQIRPTYKLYLDIYSLSKRPYGATFEEYKFLLDTYDPTLGPIAEEMASSFDAISGMEALLQELHALGYTLRIATNGGPTDYNNIAAKHLGLFGHLQDGLTVDITEPEVRKPYPAYFKRYQDRYNQDNIKTLIFIDDNKLHVDAAQAAGMIGILFKNAQQLRNDLKQLGIALT
ncbi:MAG: HAD-IA family hydrolase [Candidatus Babeliaceae bacterium]|jgi:2-haloacid dehalogenase